MTIRTPRTKSVTVTDPSLTRVSVPSQPSDVSHVVPRTVAALNWPRVRNFPRPAPHSLRFGFSARNAPARAAVGEVAAFEPHDGDRIPDPRLEHGEDAVVELGALPGAVRTRLCHAHLPAGGVEGASHRHGRQRRQLPELVVPGSADEHGPGDVARRSPSRRRPAAGWRLPRR